MNNLAELIPSDPSTTVANGWRIVVLDRGWVLVGCCEDEGDILRITKARCLRQWGTERGLGELVAGPLEKTIHDYMGIVEAPKRAVIFSIVVASDAWDI